MLKQSFKRRQRLLKAAEFKAVFDNPWKQADAYFSLFIRANQLGHARLGLAIAKKRVKAATQRNRIKRLIRESFRQHLCRTLSIDIVVMAKFGSAEVDNATLYQALNQHWQRLLKRQQRSQTRRVQ